MVLYVVQNSKINRSLLCISASKGAAPMGKLPFIEKPLFVINALGAEMSSQAFLSHKTTLRIPSKTGLAVAGLVQHVPMSLCQTILFALFVKKTERILRACLIASLRTLATVLTLLCNKIFGTRWSAVLLANIRTMFSYVFVSAIYSGMVASMVVCGWFRDTGSAAAPEVKRTRVSGGADDNHNKILAVLIKLCLKNSLDIREMQSAVLDTYMISKDNDVIAAGQTAARDYQDRMSALKGNEKGLQDLGPVHVHIWAAMVSAAAKCSISEPDQQALLAHFQEITADDADANQVACKILVAKIKKAYDKNYVKVHFAISPDMKNVYASFCKALVSLGAKQKVGQAPRGSLERELQEFLESMSAK